MKNQQGITLVNLLVGLAISMICLMALLALFRTVIHTSVDARKSSVLDMQLQNTLTTIQVLVQNAGFGYPASSVANIIEVARIENVTANKAILWRWDPDIDTTTMSICQGLTYTENSLIVLKKTCSYDESLTAGSPWEKDSILASFPTGTMISFELIGQTCEPYGSAIIKGNKVLKITTNYSTGTPINSHVCLSNILSTS